jgi:hypothetical protein
MGTPKKLLIIKATKDLCAAELEHIKTIAVMFGMEHDTYEVTGPSAFQATIPKADQCCQGPQLPSPSPFRAAMTNKGKFDYIYLAAHANPEGFGESDGGRTTNWTDLGSDLCDTNCLTTGCVLLLACCRGGLRRVAMSLFCSCAQIDYVCGPRWTVTGLDITAGFHVFVYNMEIRREQPSCAAERASKATGYDFFCYDRVEAEDSSIG